MSHKDDPTAAQTALGAVVMKVDKRISVLKKIVQVDEGFWDSPGTVQIQFNFNFV